jgi:uncharacterized phiE125 gp8 family phage protein
MQLIEETQVPEQALPLAEFRAHLRLGSGFAEDQAQDDLLAGFLRAALASIETRTGKILLEREFSGVISQWHDASGEALPVAPVSAIVEVVISDRFGTDVLVPLTSYRLEPDALRPILRPMGTLLPTIPGGGLARIRVLAGFGPDWADIPADLRQATMMLAAHFYEYRHDTALGPGCMPFGVTSLIERYRTLRLLRGGGRP